MPLRFGGPRSVIGLARAISKRPFSKDGRVDSAQAGGPMRGMFLARCTADRFTPRSVDEFGWGTLHQCQMPQLPNGWRHAS